MIQERQGLVGGGFNLGQYLSILPKVEMPHNDPRRPEALGLIK